MKNKRLYIVIGVVALCVVIGMVWGCRSCRHQEQPASIQAGIALTDLLNAFDRICGHSANIALHIIGQSDKPEDFDEMHGHMAEPGSEEYRKAVERYEEQFLLNSGL